MSQYDRMIERPKGWVGTCVSAFDEDGRCIVDDLPWLDVTEFAIADEGATVLSRDAFLARAHVPQEIAHLLDGAAVAYLDMEGTLAIHELDGDVHYLFA